MVSPEKRAQYTVPCMKYSEVLEKYSTGLLLLLATGNLFGGAAESPCMRELTCESAAEKRQWSQVKIRTPASGKCKTVVIVKETWL